MAKGIRPSKAMVAVSARNNRTAIFFATVVIANRNCCMNASFAEKSEYHVQI